MNKRCLVNGSRASSTATHFHYTGQDTVLFQPIIAISHKSPLVHQPYTLQELTNGKVVTSSRSKYTKMVPYKKVSRKQIQRAASEFAPQQGIVPVDRIALPTKRDVADAHEQSVSSDATSRDARVGLMSLPNELLGSIALRLCGDRSLPNLALVNKRLQSVAQDAMLRRLCIPKTGIGKLLTILAAKPDALTKIRHIDLAQYGCVHDYDCQCSDSARLDEPTTKLLHDIVERNTSHEVTWDRLQRAKRVTNICYNDCHGQWLDILVALIPSLKEVTMWLPPHGESLQTRPPIWPHLYQHASITPLEGPLLEIMQGCLRVLTIKSNAKYTRHASHVINVPAFRNLRSLTMSMEHLGSPSGIGLYNSNAEMINSCQDYKQPRLVHNWLPLTLSDLQLTSCTKSAFVLLSIFNSLPSGHLQLKLIKLVFDMPASSALLLCMMEGPPECVNIKARGWIQILTNLIHKGHKVDLYAEQMAPRSKDGHKATFMDELYAMTKLSVGEIAKVVPAGMQFSDCVARDLTGPRLRSAALEYKLFLLHGEYHPELLSSPRLTVHKWADVALFHGAQEGAAPWLKSSNKRRYQQQNTERAAVGQSEERILRTRRDKSAVRICADLSSFDFSVQVQPLLSDVQSPLSLGSENDIIVVLLAHKIPHKNKRPRTNRTGTRRRTRCSTLVFSSDVTASETPFDHQALFSDSSFNAEDWKWYLQPRVERVSRNEKNNTDARRCSRRIAAVQNEDDTECEQCTFCET